MTARIWLVEAVGTFLLVLICTGAASLDEYTGGGLGEIGVSLATGGIVGVVIGMWGGISGAHINPAVSLGFFLQGRLSMPRFAGYLSAQFLGAIPAGLLVAALLPEESFRALTVPQVGISSAFAIELAITLVLVCVILELSLSQRWPRAAVALGVGATVAVLAYVSGSSTGASMNPARSFGPAVAAVRFDELWLYLFAPGLGGLLGGVVWRALRRARVPRT